MTRKISCAPRTVARLCAVLFLTFARPAFADANESPQLEVVLTIGERSKDSSSERQAIVLDEDKLVWERTSAGSGSGRIPPLRKEFGLSSQEKESLLKLIRSNNLLVTETLELPRKTPGFYFELSVAAGLDGKKGAININGPRDATALKGEPLYENALLLVKELYRILYTHDKSIRFEELIR